MESQGKEKVGGGEILGRLSGLAARPFVGKARSQGIEGAVQGAISKKINQPLERTLHRVGMGRAIGKAVEVGTADVPGTPRLFMKHRPKPERQALGKKVGDTAVHLLAENPESFVFPDPISGKAYIGIKEVIKNRMKKLAQYTDGFMDELEKIAEVQPYQQQTQWTCSAACLKAVMAHYGHRLPEGQVVEAVGAEEGRGAECNQIAEAARKFGFQAFEYSFETLEQAQVLLDQDIPIICDIQSFNNPGKGHYVVMTDMDQRRVLLMDPNTPGNIRVISKAEMNSRWWDRAMAPPHELMPKWGIVVIPPE